MEFKVLYNELTKRRMLKMETNTHQNTRKVKKNKQKKLTEKDNNES